MAHVLLYLVSITFLISTTKSQQPAISTDPSYYYNLCAPSTCSNLSLPYPFNLPTPCHPSPLEASCPANRYLLLTSPRSTDAFRVLSINFTDPSVYSFFVASDSLFTCGAQVSRPNYANDATVFSLPYNFGFGTHFNCTAPIPSNSIRGLQNASCIGCDAQNTSNVCYYAPGFVTAPNCETYSVFTSGATFNASSVKNLRAYLQLGFALKYDKPPECRGCEVTGGRCGAKPTSQSFLCFCPSSVHPMNCTDGITEDLSTWVNGTVRGESKPSITVIAAISASASVLVVGIIVALVVILLRRRKLKFGFSNETISSISPTRYSYSQLKKSTNNFSSKLGEGGFGNVYKGTIHRSGLEVSVAVKILKRSSHTKKQFMSEVATIGSIHHQNLVSMLGYCVEGDIHALVYEFMENGSLDTYISNMKKDRYSDADNSEADSTRVNLKQVYTIALETARGILYLHNGCSQKILHCDIKPPNVLLGSNLSAKVSDFGLARMIDKDHSHVSITHAQGTPGYAAPEMWLRTHGPLTEKSDVYSYGMLLLEMVGRRKNYDIAADSSSQVYFPEWLYNKIEMDEFHLLMRKHDSSDAFEIIQDKENPNEEDEKAIQRMCLVGLWCIQHIPLNRPSMNTVVKMLEGHVDIGVPPQPFLRNTTKS